MVTVHFALADWVRVLVGIEKPLAAMVAGRCRVEGDVAVAVLLEGMFGGGRPGHQRHPRQCRFPPS